MASYGRLVNYVPCECVSPNIAYLNVSRAGVAAGRQSAALSGHFLRLSLSRPRSATGLFVAVLRFQLLDDTIKMRPVLRTSLPVFKRCVEDHQLSAGSLNLGTRLDGSSFWEGVISIKVQNPNRSFSRRRFNRSMQHSL